MLNTDTYAQIKARLTDWLESTGGAVTSIELDLLNRAQKSLWQYRPWDYLVKKQALTLANKSANLPSDCGQILDVYHDSDGDGRPDYHYYNESRFSDNGYTIANAFTMQSGHALSIAFFSNPTNTPVLKYQKTLSDFTGTGTEYSYFPGDLLLLKAQEIHITESGLVGPEYNAITKRLSDELRDYEQAHQDLNQDTRVVQNDVLGDPIDMPGYSLDGSGGIITGDHRDPSYDRGN
ncbi:conserved hypothetical protein [Gammaproteobacteria bacterium]